MEERHLRTAQLLGQAGVQRLQKAHVAVFGLGGVGGYAAEALRVVLEYLAVQEGIARVTAWCASDNIASKRTLEKAGMRFSGVDVGGLEIDGQRYDRLDYIYSDQESE